MKLLGFSSDSTRNQKTWKMALYLCLSTYRPSYSSRRTFLGTRVFSFLNLLLIPVRINGKSRGTNDGSLTPKRKHGSVHPKRNDGTLPPAQCTRPSAARIHHQWTTYTSGISLSRYLSLSLALSLSVGLGVWVSFCLSVSVCVSLCLKPSLLQDLPRELDLELQQTS